MNVDITKAVGLRNYREVIFYGEVNVGDPSQLFKMVFDLGSNDLWVPSLLWSYSGHPKFNASKSSTYISSGIFFSHFSVFRLYYVRANL